MTKRFFVFTLFCFFLFCFTACKKKYNDSELMILIKGKWGLRNHKFPMFQNDVTKYDFVDPVNCKYYDSDHGNGLYLIYDSLTINILDSKLYIKHKNGDIWSTCTIERVNNDKIKLGSYIYHRDDY